VLAAASEIRLGRTVTLAAPIESQVTPDDPDPAVHEMTSPPGDQADPRGLSFAMDRLAINVHGNADSHIDALCHVLAINALGLHLVDYLQFDDLVPLCEQAARWSFFCVIAPLRLPGGTGSPVNPIAIL